MSIKNLQCNILSSEIVFDTSAVPTICHVHLTVCISIISHFDDVTKSNQDLISESLCISGHFQQLPKNV